MLPLLLLLACGSSPNAGTTASPPPAPPAQAARPATGPTGGAVAGVRRPPPNVLGPGALLDASSSLVDGAQEHAALIRDGAELHVWQRAYGRWKRDRSTPTPKSGTGRIAADGAAWWFDEARVYDPFDPAVAWSAPAGCPPTDVVATAEGAFVTTRCGSFFHVRRDGSPPSAAQPWAATTLGAVGGAVIGKLERDGHAHAVAAPGFGAADLDLGPPCAAGAPPSARGFGVATSGGVLLAATCAPNQLAAANKSTRFILDLTASAPPSHGPALLASGASVAWAAAHKETLTLLAWSDDDLEPVRWVRHPLPAGASVELPRPADGPVEARPGFRFEVSMPADFRPLALHATLEGWVLLGVWPVDGVEQVSSLEIERDG
jgi:hypothetical protein